MSTVICSCLLGDNAKVRLKLSRILHDEIAQLYGEDGLETESPVCEVEMKGCRREFYDNRIGANLAIGQPVILEADGGHDFGIVYSTGRIALKKLKLKGQQESEAERLAILRCADDNDVREFTEIRAREPEIKEACQSKIERHHLDMKLVDIDLRLDQQKLSVYYTATHRVDFRGLVRDLAGEFKARIQMIQITTREEARRANTQGPCGCVLCCSSWLQKIHANPFAEKPLLNDTSASDNHSFNTIGLCNRPKCCLNFTKNGSRHDGCRNHAAPSAGSRVKTFDGEVVVESVDGQKKSLWLRYVSSGQKKRVSFDQFNAMIIRM
jgi:cell fate regulator YaaT (PSP1 superfamily)